MPDSTPQNNQEIIIEGARVHNLKNISLSIPRDQLVVITGLSGSGKSSLAFDTLYAEGQRRYVESLSAYARQFMGRLNKPDVDRITGIPPAIAIEQKVNTRNPRSTVGTTTEIYDYLKLLYARIGETYSPVSGKKVSKHQVGDVTDRILSFQPETRVLILAPLQKPEERSLKQHFEILLQQGFTRVEEEGKIHKISDLLHAESGICNRCTYRILIDRILVNPDDEELRARIADSVQTAFFEGKGDCQFTIRSGEETREESFSDRFERDGIRFEIPSVHLFSFNNPLGACPKCEGFGSTIGIDEDLVIPNKSLSIYEDAIVCWKGEKMGKWKEKLIRHAAEFDFPIHKPVYQLTEDQRQLLWTGNRYFHGLNDFFKHLEEKTYKIQYRVMLARYRGKTTCPECHGTRLRKEASWVRIGGKSLPELVNLPVTGLRDFFNHLKLPEHHRLIADRLLTEINNRLKYLV
ncbi:MAG: excinuclease ABC subunit A, partial [Bacteroidales bacterium]|nr:excinuclease ABC subunit A [Bacteroidales bacterium]